MKNKFFPYEVVDKYDNSMLHYLEYLFPKKRFTTHQFDMYHAMFVKGYDVGYTQAILERREKE